MLNTVYCGLFFPTSQMLCWEDVKYEDPTNLAALAVTLS